MISLLSALSALLAVLTDEEEFDSPYDAWKDDPYAIIDVFLRQDEYEKIGRALGSVKFAKYVMNYCRAEIEKFNAEFDWSKPHTIEELDVIGPDSWWSRDKTRYNLINTHLGMFDKDKYRPLCMMFKSHAFIKYRVYDSASYVIEEDQQLAPGWFEYEIKTIFSEHGSTWDIYPVDRTVEDHHKDRARHDSIYLPKIICNEKVYLRPEFHAFSETTLHMCVIRDVPPRWPPRATNHVYFHAITCIEIDHPAAIKQLQANGFTYIPIPWREKDNFLSDNEMAFVYHIEPRFQKRTDQEIYDQIPRWWQPGLPVSTIADYRKKCFR